MNNLNFLINSLIDEMDDFNKEDILSLSENKKDILRALMNIKDPGPMSKEFFYAQDKYLRKEIQNKGIVDIKELKPVSVFSSSEIKNANKIYLWQGDIITIKADAIVNAANKKLLGCRLPLHYCIDNTIHSFAGLQLRNECNDIIEKQKHDELTGMAKITKGYNLPSKYIIHTVGPIVYGDMTERDKELLISSYTQCLEIAEKNKLSSLVFCSISTGVFNFPKDIASMIAIKTVDDFLCSSKYVSKVVFNVYSEDDYNIYRSNLIRNEKLYETE